MSKTPKICYYSNGQFVKLEHLIITINSNHYSLNPDCVFNVSGSSKFLTFQNYQFIDPSISFKIKKFMNCYVLNNIIYAICEDTDYRIYVVKMHSDALITNVYEIKECGVYKITSNGKQIMLIDCIMGLRCPVIKLNLDLVPDPDVSYNALNDTELINFNDMPFNSYPQPLEELDDKSLICQVVENGASRFKFINENGVFGELSNVQNKSNQTICFGTEDIFRTFGNLAIVAYEREMILIDVMENKIIHTSSHTENISDIQAVSRYQFNIVDSNKITCCYISNMK